MPRGYYPLALKHYTPVFKPHPAPKNKTPQDAPTVCLEISENLIPYLLGLLEHYRWKDAFSGSDSEVAHALTMFEDLRHLLMTARDDCEKGIICRDYAPSSAIISYAPQDPFTQPDYVPPGYKTPPFTIMNDPLVEALFGFENGDVMTGITGLPVETAAIAQGLARFRVNLTGEGTVELHMLTAPFGGAIVITKDDDPLSVIYADLVRDISIVPPINNVVSIIEIDVLGPGKHHIDVSFIPSFGQTALFVGYGGGLRKVNLCGFPEMQGTKADTNTFDCPIDLGEDGMRLRINPADKCEWQMDCGDGVWTHFWSPKDCGSPDITQPAPQGELMPGQCKIYNVTLQGKEKWLAPVPVGPGYSVEVSAAAGMWYPNYSFLWYCPQGTRAVLSVCTGTEDMVSGRPYTPKGVGRLIFDHNGTFYDGYNTTTVIPANAPLSDLMFQMNDADLSDNQGSISFNVRICAPAEGTFNEENLTISATTSTPVTMTQATDPTKVYRITLSGTAQVGVDTGSPLNGDAFYRQPTVGGGYTSTDVQMWINGGAFPSVPALDSGHTYEIDKQGDGTQWAFVLHDAAYGDNAGSLSVNVKQL